MIQEDQPRSFETLTRLGQAVTGTLKLADVLDGVARAATDLLPGSSARIWVVEEDRLVLRSEAGTHGPPWSGRKTEFALGEGVTGHAAVTREPLVVEDVLADPRTVNVEWMRQEGYASMASVPLIVHDRLVGVLSLLTRHHHRFSPEEIKLLSSFGTYAAIAIQNARLYAETDRRRREAEVLADLARTINASLDLDTILQRLAEGAQELCQSDVTMIALRDPRSEAVVVRYDVGARYDGWSTVPVELGKGVGGQVLVSGRPFRTSSYAEDPRISKDYIEVIRKEAIVAELAVPIRIEARVGGVLYVANRCPRAFTDRDEAILLGLADQAAIAIKNAGLFEEQIRLMQTLSTRQARLEALLEVSRQLSQIQPVKSLLQSIAEACGSLVGSDSVGVRLVDGDELVLAGTSGDAKEVMATPRLKIGESLTGIAAATGEVLLVRDPANDPRLIPAHREGYRRLGYQAFLGVPIKLGERVRGVLSIRTRWEEGFSPEDVAMVTAFASQAAIALENSRLYEELARTQDQLLQAQKMEAIGRLAGGVAHDFNNLLTVISGRSELLLRRLRADDPLRRGLDLIHSTAERAAELTRQLLAFSRKQVLQPTVLQLNAVVAGLAPMLQRLIGEDIELLTVLDPALGPVKADSAQLEQVLMNLAVNARDAMPQGGRLALETANIPLDAAYARQHGGVDSGPYVMLAVTDTGCGMDAEIRAHIFEPFFTTKGPGKGTGLGLATVYGIVKQSGGQIWVYSEPGQGTTFKIYLPQVDGAGEMSEPGTPLPEASQGSETILLVEDEEGVRDLARDILQANGYTVLGASYGAEAVQLCKRHAGPIHLLLTDVVMPHMSGRQLAERLAPLYPEMKILYMSGYTDNAVVHHGVLDPGTAYLQKPFSPGSLARKVREVLDAVFRT